MIGEKDLLLSCQIKRDKTIDDKTNMIKKITEIYDKNIYHLELKEKFYQRNLDYLKEKKFEFLAFTISLLYYFP